MPRVPNRDPIYAGHRKPANERRVTSSASLMLSDAIRYVHANAFGLPDFAGSFMAESSFSPRASPPPPSVPETALTSTRDTPQVADPIPTLAMAWPMATIADDIPRVSVVVAPGILQHMLQPRPPLPGFMLLQAAMPSANSDGQTQGAKEPWLRYRCRYPGCNHPYASADGVRKHCRKKVRMHSRPTAPYAWPPC